MAEAAQAEELKGAFAVHLKETEGQVKRLEQVFQLLGEKPGGLECKAIQGIIEEGQEILQEFSGGEALDAGLIADVPVADDEPTRRVVAAAGAPPSTDANEPPPQSFQSLPAVVMIATTLPLP